ELLASLNARLQVPAALVERAAREAVRRGRDRRAEARQRREREREAVALLAEEEVRRDLAVGQHEVADRVRGEHLERLHVEPPRVGRQEEHGQTAALAGRTARAREQREEARDRRVRDERLAPGEAPARAALLGARGHVG